MYRGCLWNLPKGTLTQLAQDFIVGNARASPKAVSRPLVGDSKAAGRGRTSVLFGVEDTHG